MLQSSKKRRRRFCGFATKTKQILHGFVCSGLIFAYDKMWNINNLTRYQSGPLLNNLLFTYIGNQLKVVDDMQINVLPYGSETFADKTKLAIEYLYDKNGSMIYDANSGISTILIQSNSKESSKPLLRMERMVKELETVNYTLHNPVNVVAKHTCALRQDIARINRFSVSRN